MYSISPWFWFPFSDNSVEHLSAVLISSQWFSLLNFHARNEWNYTLAHLYKLRDTVSYTNIWRYILIWGDAFWSFENCKRSSLRTREGAAAGLEKTSHLAILLLTQITVTSYFTLIYNNRKLFIVGTKQIKKPLKPDRLFFLKKRFIKNGERYTGTYRKRD